MLGVNDMCYYIYGSYSCYEIQLGYDASTRVSLMYYFKDFFRLDNGQVLKYLQFSRVWITEQHFLVTSFSSFIFNRSSPCLLLGVRGVSACEFLRVVHCYALYTLSSIPAISYIFGTLQVDRSLNRLPGIFSVTVYL